MAKTVYLSFHNVNSRKRQFMTRAVLGMYGAGMRCDKSIVAQSGSFVHAVGMNSVGIRPRRSISIIDSIDIILNLTKLQQTLQGNCRIK